MADPAPGASSADMLEMARAAKDGATTELAVTDHRVIYKSGLLSRRTIGMNRDKVESVDVDQTLLGRTFAMVRFLCVAPAAASSRCAI